jgi:hypothetical protein
VVRNSIAYVGMYKVNEKDGTLDWDIKNSTFPNIKGVGKRNVKIAGDEMSLSNPSATAGGSNHQVWKRVK